MKYGVRKARVQVAVVKVDVRVQQMHMHIRFVLDRTVEALEKNTAFVMNRNNNATIRETSKYIELAARYGYLVIIIDTFQKELMPVEVCAAWILYHACFTLL